MPKTLDVHGDDTDDLDLRELFGTLYAGRFHIALITVAAIVLGLAYALLQSPVYQADALLQLEEKKGGGLAISSEISALLGQEPQVPAEIEIVKSRSILRQVIENQALNITAEPRRLPLVGDFLSRASLPDPGFGFLRPYAWSDEEIHVGRFVVPRALEGKLLTLTAQGDGRYTLDLGGGRVLDGTVGQVLEDAESGVSLLVDRLRGRAGREFFLIAEPIVEALGKLRGRFSVSEKGRNSSLLQLVLRDGDPDRAVRVLDEVAQVYLLQNVSRNAAEAEASLAFIREQLPDAEAKVAAAEAALNDFKQAQESVDLTFEMRSLLEESVQLEAQLNELKLQEYELQNRYTEQHPAYKTLIEKRNRLESRLNEIRAKIADLPQTQQDILRLSQDLEVAQQIYVQLLNRAQELSVLKAGTIGNVRIIDPAFSNGEPVAPRKKIILALAALLGLMGGSGLVLLRSVLSRGIKTPEEIEAQGVPVYATVPEIGGVQANAHGRESRQIDILAKADPTSLAVEALRSLRTSLHFGLIDAENNIVQVTSSKPNEGKSFISVNLATVSAQSGQSVCLLDADMRRGYLHKYFGMRRHAKGLSDMLAGDATLDDVLVRDPETGLYFIPCGEYPPNPAELLMHPNFGRLLRDLDARFDLVVMDSAPLLAVTDPAITAKYVSMVLIVARHLEVSPQELAAALKVLERVGVKATGAVLNGYEAEKSGYYSAYAYHYDYKARED